jgi:mono/diheme cytochrome c family protein
VKQFGWVGLAAVLLCWSGCGQQRIEQFQSSQAVLDLPAELQTPLRAELHKYTGTFAEPRLLGNERATLEHLKQGQQIYQTQCVQCHGTSGDGNGPAAAAMYPKPRDYRRGIFKFTSTRYGAKPLRGDLVQTVQRGIRGTSMPSFRLLPANDIEAVVDYVLVLTHRGELEEQLAVIADSDGEIDPALVQEELIPLVLQRWNDAREAVVLPVTRQPVFTAEHVRLGKTAFLEKGCSKCHGDDGRAQTAEDPSKEDAWGNRTRPADLTSGMLRGGQEPLDIYRRIYAGINGTPMPAFDQLLKDEPETVWNMVAYVMHVSNRRRAGEAPAPGYLRPYLLPSDGTGTGP